MKRILFFGSRIFDDFTLIDNAVRDLIAAHGRFVLVTGDARGADAMARASAALHQMPHEVYCAGLVAPILRESSRTQSTLRMIVKPSDWQFDGKRAGHLRNAAMLASGIDEAYGFRCEGESRGTDDMARKLAAAGVVLHKHGKGW